jgi:hypothetical protein
LTGVTAIIPPDLASALADRLASMTADLIAERRPRLRSPERVS